MSCIVSGASHWHVWLTALTESSCRALTCSHRADASSSWVVITNILHCHHLWCDWWRVLWHLQSFLGEPHPPQYRLIHLSSSASLKWPKCQVESYSAMVESDSDYRERFASSLWTVMPSEIKSADKIQSIKISSLPQTDYWITHRHKSTHYLSNF